MEKSQQDKSDQIQKLQKQLTDATQAHQTEIVKLRLQVNKQVQTFLQFMQLRPHSFSLLFLPTFTGPFHTSWTNLKKRFICPVRPTVHTNPTRKRSFSKTLFKLEKI